MIPNKRTLAALLLVGALLVGAVASPAAAQESDGEGDDSVLPSWEELKGLIDGVTDRIANNVQNDRVLDTFGLTEEKTASDSADELDTFVEENGPAITAYANEHVDDDVDLRQTDVVQVHLHSSDEQRTVFVTASIDDNGSVQSVDVVNQTDRTVGLTVTLDEYATRHLPGELEDANEAYLEPNREPTGLRSSLLTEYSGHVTIEEGDQPAPTQS